MLPLDAAHRMLSVPFLLVLTLGDVVMVGGFVGLLSIHMGARRGRRTRAAGARPTIDLTLALKRKRVVAAARHDRQALARATRGLRWTGCLLAGLLLVLLSFPWTTMPIAWLILRIASGLLVLVNSFLMLRAYRRARRLLRENAPAAALDPANYEGGFDDPELLPYPTHVDRRDARVGIPLTIVGLIAVVVGLVFVASVIVQGHRPWPTLAFGAPLLLVGLALGQVSARLRTGRLRMRDAQLRPSSLKSGRR